MCLHIKSSENTVGKIARNEQFFLFPKCFLPVGEVSAMFIKFEIVVCKLFQFGPVQNIVVRERVKENTCAKLFWNLCINIEILVLTYLDGCTHKCTHKHQSDIAITDYHTMPHFDALMIDSCGKHCEKRRNCL